MKILARKGTVNLVKYDNGMYGVERITNACAYGLKYSDDKCDIIDYFNKIIKTVRKGKNDINLEVYARA